MEFFYNLFIFPIETVIRVVLENIYTVSGNYGLSLIGVSAVVSLGVLPLYHIAEKWQDTERDIQKKLKPKIDEFKTVFSGGELYAYIHTLYRQNNYHPVYALRSTLGVLIQIPFFIAAYHLLSNYSALNGKSFLFFSNLGSPDQLFKIGSASINLLPFIMTSVNIVSTFIYGKKISFKENIQLYAITLFFLVVLYNSPSGLLIYWTFNNIFSLIKNIIYRIFDKKNYSGIGNKHDERFTVLNRFQKKLWVYLENNYNQYKPGAWIKITFIFISALIGVLYFLFLNHGIQKIEFLLLLISVIYFILNIDQFLSLYIKTGSDKIYKYITLLYFLTIAIIGISAVQFALGIKGFHAKKISLHLNILAYFFVYAANILTGLGRRFRHFFIINLTKKESLISYVAGLWIMGFLFFLTIPFGLLSASTIHDFEESLTFFLQNFLLFFLSFIIIGLAIYHFIPQRFKQKSGIIILICSLLFLLNVFIFTGNYGNLHQFQFLKKFHVSTLSIILNLMASLSIVILILYIISKSKIRVIHSFMMIISVSLLIMLILDAYIYTKRESHAGNMSFDNIKLSRNGKNVIIIMHDRFIGSYLKEIFEFKPELKKNLDGFTWYPKNVSPSSTTIGGVSAILGGYDYAIQNFNTIRTDVPFAEKLNETARILPYNFSKLGYYTQIIDPDVFYNFNNKKNIESTSITSLKGKFTERWLREKNVTALNDNSVDRIMRFSLFRISFPFLRTYIYDKGNWHYSIQLKQDPASGYYYMRQLVAGMRKALVDHWTTLYYLPEITEIKDDSKGSFVFFHEQTTHEPWAMNGNFEPQLDNGIINYSYDIYKKLGSNILGVMHFYTDVSALMQLSKWIEWMKKNGVYDNTRIILVSDHGMGKLHYPMFNSQKIPGTTNPDWGRGGVFQTLLMVKDFNSHGFVKENSTPMTVCDVPYLATKNIMTAVNPYSGKEIKEVNNKYPFECYSIHAQLEKMGDYKYWYYARYRINNSEIFDINNWETLK